MSITILLTTLTQAKNTNLQIKVVNKVEDLKTINSKKYKVAVVTDTKRGGLFIYNSDKKDINDGGIIFNGWIREFSGSVNAKWFCKGKSIKENIKDLNNMFKNTNYYQYYIPHTIDYGMHISSKDNVFTKLNLPNRDFVIIDNSLDSNYEGKAHQGGEYRVYLVSKNPHDANHNSFVYISSKHHPGVMYQISGDGLKGKKLSRNATTFFKSNKTNYIWGIGMGGNTINVKNPNKVTQEEELKASGFRITASGMYGKLGLSNIMNISLESGNVGWFSGPNPHYKYTFIFSEDDKNKEFVLKSYTKEFPEVVITAKNKHWIHSYKEDTYTIFSPKSKIFNLTQNGNLKLQMGISGGAYSTKERPNGKDCEVGTMIFDTTLGKPIWLKDKDENLWVDANGNKI